MVWWCIFGLTEARIKVTYCALALPWDLRDYDRSGGVVRGRRGKGEQQREREESGGQ